MWAIKRRENAYSSMKMRVWGVRQINPYFLDSDMEVELVTMAVTLQYRPFGRGFFCVLPFCIIPFVPFYYDFAKVSTRFCTSLCWLSLFLKRVLCTNKFIEKNVQVLQI